MFLFLALSFGLADTTEQLTADVAEVQPNLALEHRLLDRRRQYGRGGRRLDDAEDRRRSSSVGTYEEEECTMVQKSCTDIANCVGDVTCTGPDDSACSQCETGFSGDTCAPSPPPANYEKLDYGTTCSTELEIMSQAECSEAITSLGFTGFGTFVTTPQHNQEAMPKGCSLQKDTDTMIWNDVAAGQGRHDLAPVCKTNGTPAPPAPTPSPPPFSAPPSSAPGDEPSYQILNYRWPGCVGFAEGFDITTIEECREAFISFGITEFSEWSETPREGMPKGCSIQKNTNSMIWNDLPEIDDTARRQDLRPVCRWSGTPTPPEPTPAPIPLSRDTLTVHPEEWNYFLAFQESRRVGFSCPCGDLDWISCNEEEFPGRHFHAPNPEKVTFDCTLWIATYRHAEDQAIQNYCSHTGRDGSSPRQRAERVGAVGPGEHQACAPMGMHTQGPSALAGLQTSPGHCNSMYNPDFRGAAVGFATHARQIWTVMYNGGGDDITDSESCIPEGYNAQGDLI